MRNILMISAMIGLLLLVGVFQSWALALNILNLCLISAIMSLGINIQWGYGGLFNAGLMGFAALGGVACILIAMPPVHDAWLVGSSGLTVALLIILMTVMIAWVLYKFYQTKLLAFIMVIIGIVLARFFFDPATAAIEDINPSKAGYLGGLGLPIILAWFIGGAFAAMVALLIGKITLGLRSDYMAIATLGISEIIIAMIKNEDWLTRGVKNVSSIPRPTAYELDLQQRDWVIELARFIYGNNGDITQHIIDISSILVKLSYAGLFAGALLILYILCELAYRAPWGRMVRAMRDNAIAAQAMGKNTTKLHLQLFVMGSAIIGMAGAMLVSLDGQFTPTSYVPLRFTFLIWVMVIVGGSGNNLGAIMGGFFIWFFWIQAETMGLFAIDYMTIWLGDDSPLRQYFMDHSAHTRLMMMGIILLLVLRFYPKGLIPEK